MNEEFELIASSEHNHLDFESVVAKLKIMQRI